MSTAATATPVLRSRVQRTLRRAGLHLMHLVSNGVGDDVVGRWVRRRLLIAFGAEVGPGSVFHGGTYFSEPRNLHVGAGCMINRSCYLDLEGGLHLGDDVGLGHGTTVITTSHDMGPWYRRAGWTYHGREVRIGRGCWVGANSTLMPGVSVAAGSVVAAAALVLHDVEADTLVGGVPAKLLRRLPHDVDDGPGPVLRITR